MSEQKSRCLDTFAGIFRNNITVTRIRVIRGVFLKQEKILTLAALKGKEDRLFELQPHAIVYHTAIDIPGGNRKGKSVCPIFKQ
jgi:hypothetical protein